MESPYYFLKASSRKGVLSGFAALREIKYHAMTIDIQSLSELFKLAFVEGISDFGGNIALPTPTKNNTFLMITTDVSPILNQKIAPILIAVCARVIVRLFRILVSKLFEISKS